MNPCRSAAVWSGSGCVIGGPDGARTGAIGSVPVALAGVAVGLVAPGAVCLSLDDQVLAVLDDGRRPASGLIESATCGAAVSGQHQAQPDHGGGPDDDAGQEERSRGTSDVVAEHGEAVGRECMPAAGVAEQTGHAHDHCGHEDDEAKKNKHGALVAYRANACGQRRGRSGVQRVRESPGAERGHAHKRRASRPRDRPPRPRAGVEREGLKEEQGVWVPVSISSGQLARGGVSRRLRADSWGGADCRIWRVAEWARCWVRDVLISTCVCSKVFAWRCSGWRRAAAGRTGRTVNPRGPRPLPRRPHGV